MSLALAQEENEIILDIVKKEYKKRANLINNMVYHIEKLNVEHIISINENLRYMRSINDIIALLNASYNNAIISLKSGYEIIDDDGITEDKNSLLINNNIEKFFLQISKSSNKKQNANKLLDFSELYENRIKICNFTNIDNMIKDLTIVIGARHVYDVLYIYNKTPIDLIFSDEMQISLLEVLQQSFVPLYVTQSEKSDYAANTIAILTHSKVPMKYEILLDNFYKVKIHVPYCKSPFYIEVYGFFEYDCIQAKIRTSQLCNKIINKKKKELTNASNKKKSVPIDFKELYIKNMTIGEILSNDEKSFTSILTNDYSLFMKYSNSSFKQLFEEFMQSNLENKFNIIKILLFANNYVNLLNNNDSTNTHYANNAGLLFGLVKESKIGVVVIADVIYKHLNLSSRLKLSKAGTSIKYEIEKLNNLDSDDIDLKKQLMLNQNIPDKIKKLVLTKIAEMKSGNSEYYKQLMYVKTLIDFPWIGKHDSDVFTMYNHDNAKKKEMILNIKSKLDEKVYGHTECKETMIELMGKWFSNQKGLGKAVGLVGPPGVGKTLIAKKLGEALNIPFAQINLGGMEDGSILSGHSITYSGAVPGLIVKKMVETGKPRCIIFFDELDKTSYHHGKNEIYDTLMHVIDSTSNSEFTDKFFQEVKFPINKVLFIFSFNDKEKIDRILLDRMEIINVDSYTAEDKVSIMNDFLIKDLKEDFGFNDYNITINKEDALYLIESFTMEAGVRNIRRKLEKIFSRLNMDRLMSTGIFEVETMNLKDIVITKELIDKYINKPKINIKKVNDIPKVGNVNGLYATSIGTGGVIPILIYKNHDSNNKFKLKLTGKQGSVMKESVHFAFTIACNLVKLEYRRDFFKQYRNGLHIHTPDGATSKDGPSAGAAFTLAFISVILGKKIKNDIGLTGEIDQDGCITAIGGLENKLPGAKKAGIKLVFVPKENDKDIEKIKTSHATLFDDNFKYIAVDHIKDILDYALIENPDINTQVDAYEKLFNYEKYITASIITSPRKCEGVQSNLPKKDNIKYSNSANTLDTSDDDNESISNSDNDSSFDKR
jgi:endopeptidase La